MKKDWTIARLVDISHPMRRLLVLAVVILLLFSPGVAAMEDSSPEITICYFYNNACGSCHEDSDFHELFLSLVGDAAQGLALKFRFYNVFRGEDQIKFNEECRKYNVPTEKQITPMLIIGETLLTGTEEIHARLVSVFADEKAKAVRQAAVAGGTASNLVYFYVSPCDECAEVGKYLDGLASSYSVLYNGRQLESTLNLDTYNVAEARSLELINQYFQSYHVPETKQHVPIIFYPNGYLSGGEAIESGLLPVIQSGQGIGTVSPGGQTELKPYEWPGIFLTGLINGFNPCSISILLFLITLLIARKANVLKLGLLFILGKLIAYLLLGTLLFNLLSAVNNGAFKLFSDIGKYILLAFTFIITVMNVNDFIASKNEKYNKIRLQLPQGLRKLNHQWLRSISDTRKGNIVIMVIAFSLGMAISVGEFLCTGQIYLATIIYLIKRSGTFELQTISAFLVYIIGMLLPLAAITLAVHKGKEIFSVSEFARNRMPQIKLINASVFLAFAVIIVLFF